MKIYLSLILLFTLVSCGSAPTIEDTNQCSPVFAYASSSAGVEVISIEESYCICRKYRFSIEQVGAVGGSWREPIKSCNKVVGWKTAEYVKVAEYWQRVREYLVEVLQKHGY